MSEKKSDAKGIVIAVAVVLGLLFWGASAGGNRPDDHCTTMDFKTGAC